jgi:hypothetical protein
MLAFHPYVQRQFSCILGIAFAVASGDGTELLGRSPRSLHAPETPDASAPSWNAFRSPARSAYAGFRENAHSTIQESFPFCRTPSLRPVHFPIQIMTPPISQIDSGGPGLVIGGYLPRSSVIIFHAGLLSCTLSALTGKRNAIPLETSLFIPSPQQPWSKTRKLEANVGTCPQFHIGRECTGQRMIHSARQGARVLALSLAGKLGRMTTAADLRPDILDGVRCRHKAARKT